MLVTAGQDRSRKPASCRLATSQGSFLRRASTTVAFVVLVILFLVQPVARAGRASRQEGERPDARRDVALANARVRTVVSDLVYGFRSALPELITSQYVTNDTRLSLAATPACREDELARFFRDFHAPRDRPLVYVTDTKITWQNGEAIVTCVMIWNIADTHGRTLRLRTDEEFIMVSYGDRFRIIGSRTTPLIGRHLPNLRLLERELKRSLERTHDTHPSQP